MGTCVTHVPRAGGKLNFETHTADSTPVAHDEPLLWRQSADGAVEPLPAHDIEMMTRLIPGNSLAPFELALLLNRMRGYFVDHEHTFYVCAVTALLLMERSGRPIDDVVAEFAVHFLVACKMTVDFTHLRPRDIAYLLNMSVDDVIRLEGDVFGSLGFSAVVSDMRHAKIMRLLEK